MKEFQRAIFFTKIPLNGFYRYKDIFQIFPCNLENMPKSKLQKHYPNILEFWITPEEEIPVPEEFLGLEGLFSKNAVMLRKQDKIFGLLSTFTNNLFFRYTELEGYWGIPMYKDDPDEEANTWASLWCLNIYHSPDFSRQYKIDKFTEQTFQPIKKVQHKEFYFFEPNLDHDTTKPIVFPETINQLFDSYFALDPVKMAFVDTAISYTVSAIELKNSKKTLSLLASFTSMETMVNLEFKDLAVEQCQTCGQPKYSISRKFREYLLKYIGDSPKNKRKFNDYYSLRSKIVHTGQQLKTELLFTDLPLEEKQSELVTRIEILQMGKLAIINWLLTNPKGVG